MGDHIADTTLILNIGDHPFIEKESVVLYTRAEKLNIGKIEAELANPTAGLKWRRHECCSTQLLDRVRRGLLTSKYTKRAIKEHCLELWGKL